MEGEPSLVDDQFLSAGKDHPLDKGRLLQILLERRQHLVIVCDEFGGLSGLVILEDVLEEILGREIVDEFDQVEDMRELARRRRRQLVKGELHD